jgi:protease IV
MIRGTLTSKISLLLVLAILLPALVQADEAKKKDESKATKATETAKKETKPANKATTWAQIGIGGSYPEGASMPGIFGASVENLDTVLNRITKAATDDEIAGLVLHIGGAGVGWGKLNEFHRAINTVRKSGKKVIAYMEDAATQDYLIACACDEIIMPESGAVMMLGLRAEVTFFKNLFNKIGIQADMMRVGEYKSAAEQYTRDSMSPQFREEMEAVLDSYFELILTTVAKARKLDKAKVESIVDTGPHTAVDAKKLGLLDHVGYYDELKTMLGKEYGAKKIVRSYGKKKMDTDFSGITGMMKMMNLMMGIEPRTRASKAPKIAVIYANGIIMPGKSATDLMGSQVMGSTTIIKAVQKADDDDTVKAIVLRVDSPGGSALASDLMWRALQKCKKPIVASMGNTAASGGYYISMGAATIFAEPGTLTGSIGVVGGKLATGGVYAKIGITTDVISRGKNSGALSGLGPFSDTERKAMRKLMEDIYDQFTKKAAAGRKMDHAKLEKLARGRIYTGEMALKINLIDKLGTLDDAIAHAKKLGGIKEGVKIERLVLPKPTSPFEALFGPMGGARANAQAGQAVIKALSAISPELAKTFSAAAILKLIDKERRMTVMPYHLIIR